MIYRDELGNPTETDVPHCSQEEEEIEESEEDSVQFRENQQVRLRERLQVLERTRNNIHRSIDLIIERLNSWESDDGSYPERRQRIDSWQELLNQDLRRLARNNTYMQEF